MTTADFTHDLRLARRVEAWCLCTADRAPTADYAPGDLPFLEAWDHARERAAADRSHAEVVIDTFLAHYLDDLRDLARRARDGRAPGPVLDDIARVLSAVA